ncbi:MAG: hypothetical protein IJ287_09425 [Methanobrevibacter sp.]|nr:hypothetical protein [Methanobrevibacter sp.]
MENEGNIILAILGYIIALIAPILGLIYGAGLFYYKNDVALYKKHGRLTIYFSILLFVITTIIKFIL